MTIPSPDETQAAMISYLKLLTTLTAVVTSDEIRENQWKGRDFIYPCVRVAMGEIVPQGDGEGCQSIQTFSIYSYTEPASSKLCDQISGIITQGLHGKSFTSNNHAMSIRVKAVVPAIAQSENTWQGEVRGQLIVG